MYQWDAKSTYIQEPPFFAEFKLQPGGLSEIKGARALGIFGDSVTTDHISPAGSIKKTSPAGKYLTEHGVTPQDFNSYGSRRGNDRVMTRGTFANVRIKNLMVPGTEGGVTKCFASKGCGCAPGETVADLRRRDGVPEGRHAAGDPGRAGIRHGQLARLGGQRHCPARRQGGGSAEL